MVHGDGLLLAQHAELFERKLDRLLDHAANSKPVILESAGLELLPIVADGELAVGPEVGRDLIPGVALARRKAIEREQLYRLRQRLRHMLQAAGEIPRDVVSHDPGENDQANADEAEDHAVGLVLSTPRTMWFMLRANPVIATSVT